MTKKDTAKLTSLSALFAALISVEIFVPVVAFNIQGVVAQLTVALSVYMTISVKRRGAVAAFILNGFQSLQVASYILVREDWNAIPGVIIPLTTLSIVHILDRYSSNLQQKVDETIAQKELLEVSAEQLRRMAYYDSLTGLLSRESFMRETDNLCRAAEPFALIFIDIDGFKNINDSIGHQAGNEVLRVIAARFRAAMHPEDLLGRLGGDEFAHIIRRNPDESAIRDLVRRFMEALRRIGVNDTLSVDVSASFGVTFCPADAIDATELARYADTAMYRSKKNGKNRVEFFTPTMKSELVRNHEIERRMITALDLGEVYVVFQPQYEIEGRALHGFEALARWKSPALGEVSPAEFIPIAEYNGLICRWGGWILEEAIRRFMAVKDMLPEGVRLSVNISPRQIGERDFPAQVAATLQKTGMPARFLVLEITESSFITDLVSAALVLRDLKALGVRLALDDFGKGYASLYLIKQIPLDELKIDRDYIDELADGGSDPLVVKAIIRLSHDMGLTVIAEGVELEAQLDFLQQNGCDCLQGYLWGRPARMEAFMETWRSVPLSLAVEAKAG